MNSSKIQPTITQQTTTVKKDKKRHAPNKKIYAKPSEKHKHDVTAYYNSDNDEYDDMSEMMDLGFD